MDESDEVTYMIEHDEDMTEFILTVKASSSMSPDEFCMSLSSLVSDIEKDPEAYFVNFQLTNKGNH